MVQVLKRSLSPRVSFTLLFELIVLNTVLGGLLYSGSSRWHEVPAQSPLIPLFALGATSVMLFGFWSFGLYSRHVVYSGRRVFMSLAWACLLVSTCLIPVCYVFSLSGDPIFRIPLKFYIFVVAAFILVVAGERFVVLRLFKNISHLENVLVIGTGECASQIIREARRHDGMSLRVIGVLGESRDQVGQYLEDVPVVGTIPQTPDVVSQFGVGTILVTSPYRCPQLPIDYLLESKLSGVKVHDASTFYESIAHKMLLEWLPFTFLLQDGCHMTRARRVFKDCVDKLMAFVLIVLFALPCVAIMLLIRLISPGPVIIRQKRVGRGGKVFILYKFRTTMWDGAEKQSGATCAWKYDPRQAPIDRWLRRTHLDELPQLVNILRGDMAFVGPRPERPEFVEELERRIPCYHYRHFVKPGLTGWAQVCFAYDASIDDAREKLRYDLYYVKNMSLVFDAMILLATLRAVIEGQGIEEAAGSGMVPSSITLT